MCNSPRKDSQPIPAKVWLIAHNVPCPSLPKIFVPQLFSPVDPFFTASKSNKISTKIKTKTVEQDSENIDQPNGDTEELERSHILIKNFHQPKRSFNMKQFFCQEDSHKSVSGHHSVQQPLIPQCFSGKKFVSEAKPLEQLFFTKLEINH